MIDNSIYIANTMFPDELCDLIISIFERKDKAYHNMMRALDEYHKLNEQDNHYQK